jgi:flavin-dependent dehydrogenase
MKVAIAGVGMSGAYLYSRLKDQGHEVDLYDVRKTTACGSRPCAWGFAPSNETRRLISIVADPSLYEMHHSDQIKIDGVKIRSDLLILDKPALINGLVKGEKIRDGAVDLDAYDRVVDATGVSRAYLPPIKGDLIADCMQYRIRNEEPLGLWFNTSSIGYEWCFPLGGNEYHIGFGNLRSDVRGYRPSLVEGKEASAKNIRCRCHSSIRLTTPLYSQPFSMKGKVVGIGESIGAVAPIVADGNLYAMQTAEMLLENWDDLEGYSEKVLARYAWMTKERRALDKMMAGKMPSLSEAWTMKMHSNMVGVEMRTMHVLKLFRKMAQSSHDAANRPADHPL